MAGLLISFIVFLAVDSNFVTKLVPLWAFPAQFGLICILYI